MGRRKKHAPPALREHKALGLAYVTLDGKQVYLGPVGSPKAAKAYRKIVDDWERSHVPAISAFASGPFVTVAELIAAHAAHAKIHYRRPDGQETDEVKAFARAMALVYKNHADDSPNDFRPRDLHAIIDQLVKRGLSRGTVNKMAGKIKRVWQWGVSHDMVSAEAAGALLMVGNLQAGRTKAHDYPEVLPVDLRVLVRTLRLVPPTIATMLRVQYYCGARPGEVCAMRGDEIHKTTIRVKKRTIDLPPGVWAFIPSQHKNLSKGKSIRYLIGPRLQRILTPFLTTDGYLFSAPKRSYFRVDNYAQHIERACHEAGVTCQGCGHEWRRYEKREKTCPVCGATGDDLLWALPRWSPNQLRHNFLTRMDRLVGIAAASSAVSHASVATTAVYVEANLAGDAERAKRFG